MGILIALQEDRYQGTGDRYIRMGNRRWIYRDTGIGKRDIWENQSISYNRYTLQESLLYNDPYILTYIRHEGY